MGVNIVEKTNTVGLSTGNSDGYFKITTHRTTYRDRVDRAAGVFDIQSLPRQYLPNKKSADVVTEIF